MLTYFTTLLGAFMAPKIIATLGTVLGLVLADFLLGVFLALKAGKFQFSQLPRFMETSFVPYVGGLLILALFSSSNTELSALFFTIAATITAKFLADVGVKVSQLFSGIKFQSPIEVTNKADPQPVSPQTNAATNTPAATKTVPAESTKNQ